MKPRKSFRMTFKRGKERVTLLGPRLYIRNPLRKRK